MTPGTLTPLILLALSSAIFLAEAWLEETVIRLKNDQLTDYGPLNKKEHARSMILSSLIAGSFCLGAAFLGYLWLLPALIVNRRLVFDPMLKVFRKRKLTRYEGNGPVDLFFVGIFGRSGARWELLLELALTAGSVVLTIINR